MVLSFFFTEAFQGVGATTDIAAKTGDNLLTKYRHPTETGRKARQFATGAIHFQFLFVIFATVAFVPNQTRDRRSRK